MVKIYCSGVGGIGLSAYAALQNAAGHTVLGSDRTESELLDDLRGQGIAVFREQDGSRVTEDLDLFVYSEAIPADAPERRKAAALGIPQQSYFQALGELSRGSFVIAVCGTHGKSSTTAMAARVLLEAGRDPTVVVGTKLRELSGRNWRKGGGNLFLLEACEYRRSFHRLSPDLVLLTNADGDHFDAFSSLEEYQHAFVGFLRLLPEEGSVITHCSDPDCRRIVERAGRTAIDADVLPLLPLGIPGRHMQENAQLVLGMAQVLALPEAGARRALMGYQGCWRRMEVCGTLKEGVTVIDDYGHHPKEIRAVLRALRERYPGRRIVCAFQPHTHDRTLKLYQDFTACFPDADDVIVTDVYEARSDIESARVDIAQFLSDIARESGVAAVSGHSLTETRALLLDRVLRPNDVLLCIGAGDITTLARSITDSHP